MPPQLFTSLASSSTPGDIVGVGFFRSESPNIVLSAADNALRSGSSSLAPRTRDSKSMVSSKEGPYQDRPPLCPFRLLPLLIYSGLTIAFLKILKVQGPKSKKIENVILLQP